MSERFPDRDEADAFDRDIHGVTRGPFPHDPGATWQVPEQEDMEPDGDSEDGDGY